MSDMKNIQWGESKQVLKVEKLSFKYRDRIDQAITDISMHLDSGELLLLAGSSGCGKTTLARCINGLIPRSYKGDMTGTVLIDGEETRGMTLAQISQNVGTVLQDPERQILGTKVMNEVAFGLENLGLSRPDIVERAHLALEQLGIKELRGRDTFNLSGGEKQKVALAGVLAMRPRLLLLDEPLASLDPESAQEALQMIRDLVDDGMGVVIIEHRVEDVLKIHPDRVLFMQDGSIRFEGDVEEFTHVVDYREVKLPAKIILIEAAKDPPQKSAGSMKATAHGNKQVLVDFRNVSFAYERELEVIQDVNFEIRTGDIIAVLGPNGAGKTTLVKHAIGLLKPRSGTVRIGGEDTRDLSVAEIANTLGYVFQSPSHMLFAPSVSEELSFGPTNLGHPKERVEEEVRYAIDTMNLSGMETDPPLALSFGQQKRVSIAAILAMQSRILIMDEPTAGQDYRNYMDFMDAILQLPSFESILFITHDVDLAVIYANRVLLINEGRLVADGPPEEVLMDYDRLQACRLRPTSLLDLNLEVLDRAGTFRRAEELAHMLS
jgi:energy-coupling factor transporter ATP-binding protein EcfA2